MSEKEKKVNILYSPEEKRKIILVNYTHPNKQVELEELKKKSESWQVPWLTFRSLDTGCGDVIHLLIKKKGDCLEKCLFSGQQSCLITIAMANITCSYLEGRNLNFAHQVLNNCQAMIEKKEYNLDKSPNLQVFADIFNFPHRVECIKLVIRGINNILLKEH
jgi:NifU-like protein involved in Fe-S cluster formation